MPFLTNISSPKHTDTELVCMYRESGDLQVLGLLYQRYMELVYGVCLKYYKEPEKAKDGVMQIFEELITRVKKHEIENFKGWLYQVAKNHCLMYLRSPRNVKTVDLPPSLMQTEDYVHLNGVFEKEEHLTSLEDCLSRLEEDQRLVIRLFYLEGKSYHEIVQITGQEWNQVRSKIQNGRRNLKLCMDKKSSQKQEIGKTPNS